MRTQDGLRVALALAGMALGTATAGLHGVPPPPRPQPTLQLSGPDLIRGTAATSTAHAFDVRYSGSGGHLDVRHDLQALEAEPGIQALGDGRFRVTLHTRDDMPEGLSRGTLTVRMCKAHPCANPIAGAVRTMQLRVHLAWADAADWSSYQGNARHDGHVRIAVDPRRITAAWSTDIQAPAARHVATAGDLGVVAVQSVPALGGDSLIALDLRDGSLRWRHDFAEARGIKAPATSGDRVYVPTLAPTPVLWSLDAGDGTVRWQSPFLVQWPALLAPTIANGVVHVNAGQRLRQGVYGFDADDGMPLWTAFSSMISETTPAVANGRAYHYDARQLNVYDAFDGTALQAIADPTQPSSGVPTYGAAPMLGSPDHVVVPSGDDYWPSRPLVDFSPAQGKARWVSTRNYFAGAAGSDGVIHAVSNAPHALDAIDEGTGQVLASWAPAPGTSITSNVVLTRNLAFISTTAGTLAIDRGTHLPVWSTPVSGELAISGTGMLLVTESNWGGPTRIHAWSLRGR